MGHLGIVKKRAAWATLLEAAYDPVPDDGTWGEQILGVARDAFETRFGTALYAVQHDAECTTVQTLVDCRTGALAQGRQSITPAALGLIGADAFRAFHYPPLMVTTHSEIEPALEPGLREVLRRERKGADAADVVGIVVHPEPGVALVLCSVLERELSLAKHERHLLAKLGLHLAAAFRLRRRPESVCAVISLDGRILEGGGLGGGDHVARQVLQIEGSRSKAQGDDLIDLWTALMYLLSGPGSGAVSGSTSSLEAPVA